MMLLAISPVGEFRKLSRKMTTVDYRILSIVGNGQDGSFGKMARISDQKTWFESILRDWWETWVSIPDPRKIHWLAFQYYDE
jgi:hypothetical protein